MVLGKYCWFHVIFNIFMQRDTEHIFINYYKYFSEKGNSVIWIDFIVNANQRERERERERETMKTAIDQ